MRNNFKKFKIPIKFSIKIIQFKTYDEKNYHFLKGFLSFNKKSYISWIKFKNKYSFESRDYKWWKLRHKSEGWF